MNLFKPAVRNLSWSPELKYFSYAFDELVSNSHCGMQSAERRLVDEEHGLADVSWCRPNLLSIVGFQFWLWDHISTGGVILMRRNTYCPG